MSINRRLLTIFAIIVAVGAYIMVLLGVLVTFTGSGHGCGQTWPFCQGEIIPGTLTISAVIEYTHRLQAGADGLLVMALVVWSWLTYRRDFRVKLFAVMSVFFVLAQGALGAVTVVYEGTLAFNWVLAAHFGLSLLAFASVALLAGRFFQLDENKQLSRPRGVVSRLQWPVWGLAAYTYVVMYTGALVEHTGAVTACGQQLPGCGSTYLPSFATLAGIQVLHRYAAGFLWVLMLALLVVVVRNYRERRDVVRGTVAAFVLITLQAVVGLFNVLSAGQMVFALIHATLITLFFAVLCYLCTEIGRPGQRDKLADRDAWRPFKVQGNELVPLARGKNGVESTGFKH